MKAFRLRCMDKEDNLIDDFYFKTEDLAKEFKKKYLCQEFGRETLEELKQDFEIEITKIEILKKVNER